MTRIPNNFKWAMIKAWAQACLAWTYRNRERIAAGIVMRSDNWLAQRAAAELRRHAT